MPGMPTYSRGHELEWLDHPETEPDYGLPVYGMAGMFGRTLGEAGRPPGLRVICRTCRHCWTVDVTRETWDRLQSWERQPLGDALAADVVRRDRLTCEDRRDLLLCREVMES